MGMACVDRHIFFITPLSSSRDADLPPRPPWAQRLPQPRPATTATRAWLGRTSSSATATSSSLRPSSACAAQKGCGSGGRSRQNAAGNRQARGCGGAQSASLPFALKWDAPRTLPHAHAVTPMRLHRVPSVFSVRRRARLTAATVDRAAEKSAITLRVLPSLPSVPGRRSPVLS